MFKIKFLWIISFSIPVISCAQVNADLIPQTYTAYKTPKKIIIDGSDSDEAWGKVAWTNSFVDIEGVKKPKYKTAVKMLWDDEYYYILAKMEEPHVWGNLTKRDTIIFHNNDFEVFVEPDGDTHNYYELEINALNTVWDLFITKPYRNENVVLNDWNIVGLKSAVKVNGTLNNPTDIDEGWILEIAIPWKVYKTGYFHKNIPADKFWRVNFSRVNWDFQLTNSGDYERKRDAKGKLLHEYNWVWSPTGVVNMHEPEKWGYVFFSTEVLNTSNPFIIPQDEKIKWELYKMYRVQNAHFKAHKAYFTSVDSLINSEIKVENHVLIPVLENHSTGWNLSIKSPFTNKVLIVTEDGKFITN
ncbi:carbohydrate-binding family 9-like protein [Pseudalgibacter alginicilyticus]|uniref:Carbohydrate-binding family 9-like protein n=1 Tax=Pseudalgibacter alginicilyticus TaxID=1736674 RepID=A0A0P0D8W7_9FLAO|nr:carbohydrate-binding family 9-like protein [Pseudalgibacter alginicilyticus]ALJ04188.1 carbohydrate-binding family 9-like protein [Pseudalgibacter alginicilyticus]